MYKILLTLLLTGANLFGKDKSAEHAVFAKTLDQLLMKHLAQLLEQHSKVLLSQDTCPPNLGSEIDKLITPVQGSSYKYAFLKTTFANQAFAKFEINVFTREEQVLAPSPYQRWWISARIGKCLVDIHRLQNDAYIALKPIPAIVPIDNLTRFNFLDTMVM